MQKKKLTDQIMAQDSVSNVQQLDQAKQTFAGAQMVMTVFEKKSGDLLVRSPVDGQLTSLDAEIGQNKNKGERLGQIDVLTGFKVRVDVDEHYMSRIYSGLKGKFTFADSNYDLKIFKVFTQVTGGHFQVDMSFVGKVPKGIRRGQTLQILLALSEERQWRCLYPGVVSTSRPAATGSSKSAKMAKPLTGSISSSATRTRNIMKYCQGLKPGDKVVTSSYENYGTMQELILKK